MEKKLKYTGTVTDDYGKVHHCIGTDEEPELLMGEYGFYGDEKDAKLIASAPELLEALSDAIEWAKEYGIKYIIYEKMEQVIKKATE